MTDTTQQASQSQEDAAAGAQAFLASLMAAAEQGGGAPDPAVSAAFALGWQMSELYQPAKWPSQPPPRGERLPGLSKLSGFERAQVGLSQVDVALNGLKKACDEHGLRAPTTAAAREALGRDPTDETFRDAIFDLHVGLLATLTAANFKLGKAYGLGRALADTTRRPHDTQSLRRQLEPHRVARLRAWIVDLTTALPAHAGHSVDESLRMWRDWASPSTPKTNRGEDTQRVIGLLRRQGERWRALLSGEKLGADALELHDYVAAGSSFLRKLGGLTWRFLLRFLPLVLLIATLFGLGVWVIISNPNSGHIAAGLGGVLASLGLTWKGVGGSLGKAVGKLERPVWEAALDSQIAVTITLLPGSKRAKDYVEPTPRSSPSGETPSQPSGDESK